MFNHSSDPDLSFAYDENRKGFVVTALKDIALGSEIFYFYNEIIHVN